MVESMDYPCSKADDIDVAVVSDEQIVEAIACYGNVYYREIPHDWYEVPSLLAH